MFDNSIDTFPIERLRDQPERTPRMIEQMGLTVTPTSPLDEVIAALDAAEWLSARARMIVMVAKAAAIAWIDRNGEFDVGEMHYSVGYYTTTKCVNVPRCGVALLDALEGDFDRFLTILSSDAFKFGAARSALGRATFGQHFTVKPASRLNSGIPERILKRADPTFAVRKNALQKKQ